MLHPKIANPRYPHRAVVTRRHYGDDPFSLSDSPETMYSGVCRNYTDTTTTGGGSGESHVDVNRRKLSVPVRYDGWRDKICPGDLVTVTMGDIEENGVVTDFEPDNNRSVIYWEYIRN